MAAWVLVHQYRLRAILRRSFLLCPRGELSQPVFRPKGEKNNSTQTTYHRQIPATRPKKYVRDENASDKESIEKQPRSPGTPDVVIRDVDRNVPSAKPPTFLSQLKIYNGTFTDDSVWKIFFRPLPFVLSPVVRTACDDFLVPPYLNVILAPISQTWFVFLAYSMQTVWLSALRDSRYFSPWEAGH